MAGYSSWGCKRVRHGLVTTQQLVTYIFLNSSSPRHVES